MASHLIDISMKCEKVLDLELTPEKLHLWCSQQQLEKPAFFELRSPDGAVMRFALGAGCSGAVSWRDLGGDEIHFLEEGPYDDPTQYALEGEIELAIDGLEQLSLHRLTSVLEFFVSTEGERKLGLWSCHSTPSAELAWGHCTKELIRELKRNELRAEADLSMLASLERLGSHDNLKALVHAISYHEDSTGFSLYGWKLSHPNWEGDKLFLGTFDGSSVYGDALGIVLVDLLSGNALHYCDLELFFFDLLQRNQRDRSTTDLRFLKQEPTRELNLSLI